MSKILRIIGILLFWLTSLAFLCLAVLIAYINFGKIQYSDIDSTVLFAIFCLVILGLILNPLIYALRPRQLKNGFVYFSSVTGLALVLYMAFPALMPNPNGQIGEPVRGNASAYWLGYVGNNFLVQDLYASTVTVYESRSHKKLCSIELKSGAETAQQRVTLDRNKKVVFAVIGNNSQTGRVVSFKADDCSEINDYNYLSEFSDVRYVRVSADSRNLLVVRGDGQDVIVFDTLNGVVISNKSSGVYGDDILGSVFAEPVILPSSTMVIGAADRADQAGLSIYDLRTLGRLIGPIRPGAELNGGDEQGDLIKDIAVSGDGQIFATCTTSYKEYESSVDIWRVSNGQKIVGPLLDTIENECESLAFSPDGQYLAISGGGKLSIWDLKESAYALRLKTIFLKTQSNPWLLGLPSMIPTTGGFVTFSPDSKLLLTGSEGLVREWDVDRLVGAVSQ
jgi:hypothetical protein